MKKNKTMRLAAILLVCVLLTTSVISGTFAKYISTATGSSTARVAKWDITVEDKKLNVDNTDITFNLFDYTDANVDVNGLNDDAKVIAPGTSGSFKFDLTNNSEVNAKYTIAFTEENNNNIPLQYSVNGTEWKDSIAELGMTSLTDQAINMGASDSQTIYWRWVFEGTAGGHQGQNDGTDTYLGIGGNATVTIKASVTVTQVD